MLEKRWTPHVTVAAIVEHEGRFLLVEEETADGLRLNNPAGHLDPGESPVEGVVREVLEETTRRFCAEALVGVYLARHRRPQEHHDVSYLRLAFCGSVADADPLLSLDTGIVRTLWLSADEIRASVDRHRSPLLVAGIDDYLAGRRFPLDMLRTDASVLLRGLAVAAD